MSTFVRCSGGQHRSAVATTCLLTRPRSPLSYQRILPLCHLIVGTRQEIGVVGGSGDLSEALRAIRQKSAATIVVKAGAAGAVAYSVTMGPTRA